MKHVALKRRTPLRGRKGFGNARTRIASRSPRRMQEERKYAQSKAEHFADHPGCQWPGCCRSLRYGHLIDIHHKAGRIGPLLYTKKYFVSLCRQHHDHVENNASWSRANGWIIDLSCDEVRKIREEETQ